MFKWAQQTLSNVAGTKEPYYGPTAIQPISKIAETTPYTELKKEDLKWVAMTSTCVETQTFYLMADSGHIGLVQVVYSNVVGLHTTTQFNTKIFYPDGKTPNLWSADPLTNHGFDEDNLCFYADNVAVTLSEDGKSFTIKAAVNNSSIVNLTVTQLAPGFVAGNDGKTFFGTDPANPWGSMRHAFWPRNKLEGIIITKEGEVNFAGKAMFVHALQGMKPHHAAAKWNFLNFQGPTYSAIMMEYTTPEAYANTMVNVGGIAKDGQIICAGSANSATHTETENDVESDWSPPTSIKLLWSGKIADGKTVDAVLEGPLGQRLDKVDVMAEVPQFVKKIIGGVSGTKPYIYQYSPEPKLKLRVKVGDEEFEEEGVLFAEATFISA